MLSVFCDGSIKGGNPGGHGVGGWVVKDGAFTVLRGAVDCGHYAGMTNNISEYNAVLFALRNLIACDFVHRPVSVFSDSKLVICQVNGEWQISKPNFIKYRKDIWASVKKFPSVDFAWIPRAQNAEADAQSRTLYDL